MTFDDMVLFHTFQSLLGALWWDSPCFYPSRSRGIALPRLSLIDLCTAWLKWTPPLWRCNDYLPERYTDGAGHHRVESGFHPPITPMP